MSRVRVASLLVLLCAVPALASVVTLTNTVTFSGNGSNTSFNIPYEFEQTTDLTAIYTPSGGSPVTWTQGTQYTVTQGIIFSGGVTYYGFLTTQPGYTLNTGDVLVLSRSTSETQTRIFQLNGPFNPADITAALDQGVMMVQDLGIKVAGVPQTDVFGNVNVPGSLYVDGGVTVGGSLYVDAGTTLNGSLYVDGGATVVGAISGLSVAVASATAPQFSCTSGSASCTLQSGQASGSDAFRLNTTNLYSSGNLLNIENQGTPELQVALNGSVVSAGSVIANSSDRVPSVHHALTISPQSIEFGIKALSSGAGTASFTAAFSGAPTCVCTDASAANPVKCSTSTTAVTIAGTGTDSVFYFCIGNM